MKNLFGQQFILHQWERFRASYWFIPVCLMLISCSSAFVFISLIDRPDLPDWVQTIAPMIEQGAARQLLSTLASSIITATSIAFSMTIVALTMASAQFGPRLLRTFMLDKGTQWILGILLSSFLFCLIATHQLDSFAEFADARSLLVATAMLAMIIDIFGMIYFLHHIARFIQADQVIYRSYREFISNINHLFPQPTAKSTIRVIADSLPQPTEFQHAVLATDCGYVEYIDYECLLQTHPDLIAGIEVFARSGDHIFTGHRLMTIHANLPLSDAHLADFAKQIRVGTNRTPIQDVEFAISQLVELALRALSPGINDPYSAMACLDKLTSACAAIGQLEFPAQSIVDTQSNSWLKRRTFTLEGVINTAYDQIRQASVNHVAMIIYQLQSLYSLRKAMPETVQPLISAHCDAIFQLTDQQDFCGKDRRDIEEAYALAR